MVLNIFTRTNKTANLILRDHVIRFIELKQHSPILVTNYGERFIPQGIIRDGKIVDENTLSTILEECIDNWGIKKRNVRIIVPDQYVVIRSIQVPADLHNDEIRGYLYLELGTSIHLPFDDPVFDYVVLGSSEEKKNVLLFAAPEEIVMQYSDLLTDLKLKPLAADISSLCMYRLYHATLDGITSDHLLVLQFNLNTVNTSIFHEDKPIFMRHLYIEGSNEGWENQLTKSGIMEYKWIGQENERLGQLLDVYKEIENVINFYRFSMKQGREGIKKIFLCGDHPNLVEISHEIKDRFEIDVDIMNSELITTVNGEVIHPNFHLAIGLALKEVR
jgi:type IV pilus assembly protein PilM